MVRSPSLFLMDEPLSNLDAKLRHSARREFKRLHAETGVTTIYVTHDQVEAMGLGQRVAIMNFGKIQQIGTPHERSEEHTSELQSLMRNSYAVFCLKKKQTFKPTETNACHMYIMDKINLVKQHTAAELIHQFTT